MQQTNGGFLISKIKQIQGRVFEKLLSRQGVDQFSGAQGRILYVLWNTEGIPISELSERTGLAKTTLTGMLDRMEASGQIRRVPDAADRRRTNICLTAEARALQADYDAVSDSMNAIFYHGFAPEEILTFETMLARVLQNLTGKEDQL